jgi:hypothetical protein
VGGPTCHWRLLFLDNFFASGSQSYKRNSVLLERLNHCKICSLWINSNQNKILLRPEAVFLVSLRMSLFPAGNEVCGKSIESSFLAGNELAPSSFPAWLKIRPLIRSNTQSRNIRPIFVIGLTPASSFSTIFQRTKTKKVFFSCFCLNLKTWQILWADFYIINYLRLSQPCLQELVRVRV